MVVGLDVHKKKTVGFVATGTIERGEWFECATTKEGLEGILPMLAGHKVLVEASTSGKAVVRLLRQHGADVDLVQPDVLTSMMRKAKSDKIDARDLTRVGLIGGYSTCYIPTSEEEALRSVTRHMQTLTEKATRLKNEIRSIPQRNLVPEPVGGFRSQKGQRAWLRLELPPFEKKALTSKLAALEHAEAAIDDAMLELCELVHDNENVKLLMTTRGVDVYTASVVVAECGEMTRFATAKKVASYTGLTPRLNQSGETSRGGRITRRGPSQLRQVLVEAAHRVVIKPGRLRNKYARLKTRIGGKRALVAIARTLVTMFWSMLVNRTPFEGKEDDLSAAKIWRCSTVAQLHKSGQDETARKLLNTNDVRRAHTSWAAGRSKLVPS